MTAIRTIRTALAVGMIVVGVIIVGEMVRYPIAYTFTGVILGLALIALGIVRLRAIYVRSQP